ncbi:HHR163Wp [Eremothecium sinecaudum]|uniref:Sulfhydryl oxidase n=1 Tax=Eremothecium sinecaudum TaxID=45286 RepID=A0A0X8HWU7_9SACH|nr:HHR163Wp [Eremothecium sinecaudum]AMD22932.1 HHR163Wp [Eremothecium sinecaudum]
MDDNKSESKVVGPSGRKIVYDKDGKPCRVCNTMLDFQFATGGTAGKVASSSKSPASEIPNGSYARIDPPDVEQLGRSSWTLLHSIAARYPEAPSTTQKQEIKQFMTIFSHIYPCNWCAKDFEEFIRNNAPRVDSREELGRWLCEAHNDVNKKLGKEEFNCNLWTKRWVDGWD